MTDQPVNSDIELDRHRRYHFVGVGGIGMSALARFFNERKVHVSGYDKTPTPLTDLLIQEGIDIHFEENISMINQQADLVVYTPAIPATHKELVWYQHSSIDVVKRSDILQSISQHMQAICVAGTHGKTTISALI